MSGPSCALEPHWGGDCYMTILMRTAKLVQQLAQTALPPGIDLVFEVERACSRALAMASSTATGEQQS